MEYLIGCKVISQASSGVLQTLKNSFSARSSLNSGKYRPACRITQTGTYSTSSPRAARRRTSFLSAGKSV
jgi:hypothetical protein